MKRLLMIAPAPVLRTDTGYLLDKKFISGMELHCRFWPGQIDCLLREGEENIPFGAEEFSSELQFGLKVLDRKEAITSDCVSGYDVLHCGIDDVRNLGIVDLDLPNRPRIFATIEYTLRTRLQVALLDSQRSIFKRIRTVVWLLRQEPRRRSFIRKADGLQTNGYPAFAAFRQLNKDTLLYFDSRMTESLFATEAECVARFARLRSGAPLRLVYSGRLERMKGVHDLIPIVKELKMRGLQFHLDIFGSGSLRDKISSSIIDDELSQYVTLHAAVDFETELVPYIRKNSDIFLCCHRQSDPSCSYLENMGCGLAVFGCDNQMWKLLHQESDAGWLASTGNVSQIADTILKLDADREEVVARCKNALAFAQKHDFLSEFQKRMNHLSQ